MHKHPVHGMKRRRGRVSEYSMADRSSGNRMGRGEEGPKKAGRLARNGEFAFGASDDRSQETFFGGQNVQV